MSDYDRNASARWGTSVGRAGATEIDQGLRAYMLGVYNYMTLGLAVTGVVALGLKVLTTAGSSADMVAMAGRVPLNSLGVAIYGSPLKWLFVLAPVAFVFLFPSMQRMSAAGARNMFVAFAAVMGLSMSTLLLVFTGESVARAFFVTAASFGALSLYGYTTRKDLSAFGSFLVMGLFGLIIAGLVNMFVQSSAMQFGLSILSVLIFAGLTAWDTQMIREMYYASDDHETATRKSIWGALRIYLDFINIFQSILSLTGSRND